jgi:excisionase family DNA binding protein
MTEVNQEFMTLEEISKRYNLPLSTLRRWAWERRFSLYNVSNKIRVSVKEWEDYWEQFHIKGGGNGD